MCGITGVFEYAAGAGSVSHELIGTMTETIAHRGPDGEGAWISEDRRVGLGHRRLAIVDIAHGAQPMHGRGGEVLIFNGEIYNYPELRRSLERDGVQFETHCDTEVILRLYERHGEACVEFLNGMFAFAIWDPRQEALLIARDPVGEKPLYWSGQGGRLVFGSEIKALLAHPSMTREVNGTALDDYLTHLVTIAPETLFRGIFKLPPGHLGVCDRHGMRVRRYRDLLATRTSRARSFGEAAEIVRDQLGRSVSSRMMSDVPVGVLLSGGLDSTAIVALLAERRPGIATFSVGFEDQPRLDERAQARRVAEHFGTDHHEIVLSEDDAIAGLTALVHHQDEPLADPVCLPLNAVCGLAREHGVKVVLAGEGADELFWGYPRYLDTLAQWRKMKAVLALPGPVRARVPDAVPARLWPLRHDFVAGLASGRPLPAHLPVGIASFHRQRLLGQPAGPQGRWRPADEVRPSADPLERLAFDTQEYEFGLRLPELLLMRIDRFSMANGVEARVPFLDPDLVDQVYGMPLDYKISRGQTKLVLKEALGEAIPSWVLSRRKQGFGAPVASWMSSQLGTVLGDLLRQDSMGRYFDISVLEQELARAAVKSSRFALWPIMNFALWHRHWIEEMPIEPASPVGAEPVQLPG